MRWNVSISERNDTLQMLVAQPQVLFIAVREKISYIHLYGESDCSTLLQHHMPCTNTEVDRFAVANCCYLSGDWMLVQALIKV